jgi:hypothetical protein
MMPVRLGLALVGHAVGLTRTIAGEVTRRHR